MRVGFFTDIVLPALMLCWAALLGYGAIAGASGYRALAALDAERAEQEAALEVLREHRLALEKRADLLSSKSLDGDIVDERVRQILGYSEDGDVIVSRAELDRLLEHQAKNAK